MSEEFLPSEINVVVDTIQVIISVSLEQVMMIEAAGMLPQSDIGT